MFRKILIVAMFATAAGYCFAAQNLPQVVTSEVFYDTSRVEDEKQYVEYDYTDYEYVEAPAPVPVAAPVQVPVQVPVWPLAGSDADVEVSCESGVCTKSAPQDNIKIVSKIGSDLVVENNFNLGAGRAGGYGGWSGGANMLHGTQIPVGFANECAGGAEMPLLSREMLEDDGAEVLSVSRSSRPDCTLYADGYTAYLAKLGIQEGEGLTVNGEVIAATDGGAGSFNGAGVGPGGMITSSTTTTETEISVDVSADAEAPAKVGDQVRSWVVANGQTLRSVLQNWADKEGWDLVWATSREYPIEASAVFRGRFVDVASALVRNFSRATPIPYAKFYKGNRVLVITTNEE